GWGQVGETAGQPGQHVCGQRRTRAVRQQDQTSRQVSTPCRWSGPVNVRSYGTSQAPYSLGPLMAVLPGVGAMAARVSATVARASRVSRDMGWVWLWITMRQPMGGRGRGGGGGHPRPGGPPPPHPRGAGGGGGGG